MNLIEAIIYGLIQGLTEFLPVSSSGHITLLGRLFDTDPEVMYTLSTWLHMGTLIAVFVVMRREILAILRDIFGPKTWQIIIATIPAVVAALLLGDWLDDLFGGRFLGVSFWITGIFLMTILLVRRERDLDEVPAAGEREIGWKQALIAGIGQAVAILPGVSRSGSTLTALLLSRVNRKKAIRFSFLMSIPAIAGGFILDLKEMISGDGAAIEALGLGNLLFGVLAAGVAGWLAMEWMLRRLNRRGLLACAIYVFVLGSLVIVDQQITNFFF